MIRYFKGNNENTRMASIALFLHMLLALNKDVAPSAFIFYFEQNASFRMIKLA